MSDNFSKIDDLINYIENSPTAWHAVEELKKKLQALSFIELREKERWDLKPGQKYFVVRNGSSICAFITPTSVPEKALVVGAHTDSPALKIKPNGEYCQENVTMLSVEIYGGPLLSSWLNRDLMIAGKVVYADAQDNITHRLVHFPDHLVTIPQLAIHLDRNVNDQGPALNKQLHLNAVAALNFQGENYLKTLLSSVVKTDNILSTELFLVPFEKPQRLGFQKEMIASYRFDNLGSAHAAIDGLISESSPKDHSIKMVMFWDHEEIGSNTTNGAGSPFFMNTLERILLSYNQNREDLHRVIDQSICLSIDQAHALHPNYKDKHDPKHAPLLGKGIVIKHNAQQRYATSSETEAVVVQLCQKHQIPYQKFVSRNDVGCGSTIGPIHATITGMKCVDLGSPQLSMHSCRELAACDDHLAMCSLTKAFFE